MQDVLSIKGKCVFSLVAYWSYCCCFLVFEEFLDFFLPCSKKSRFVVFLMSRSVRHTAYPLPETLACCCSAWGCVQCRAQLPPHPTPGLLGCCLGLPSCPRPTCHDPSGCPTPRGAGGGSSLRPRRLGPSWSLPSTHGWCVGFCCFLFLGTPLSYRSGRVFC